MESTKVSDGTTRTPSGVHIRDATTTRDVHYIYVHDGVSARLVYIRYTAMQLSDSGDVSGSCSTAIATDCEATTSGVTVTVTNGRAPFTYAWSYVSGATATVNSPTAATTTFTRSAGGSAGGTQYQGVYRCTVTDATGRTATNDVTVTTTHTSTLTNLSATGSAASVSGTCNYATPTANCAATTGSVTITPSGGVGPYTYAWTNISGDTATVNSATAATTTFTRTASGTNGGQLYSGVYRCTVTDSQARTATVNVTVNTTHTNTYVTPTASASGNATGSCSTNNGNGCTSTTNSVTVTPANGTAPYSYAWARVLGDTFTINSASAATTTFSKTAAGSTTGTVYSGTYRCTVTDNIGTTCTADITVTSTHTDSYTALSVSRDADASGSCSYTSGNCTATTGTTTVSVSGGLAPYTYSWSYLSGTTATVNSPSAAATTFSRTATGTQTLSGWYRCTVTDSTSRTATVDVYVSTTHTNNYVPMTPSKDSDAYGLCALFSPGATCTATTNSVTVSVTGGVGGFTYAWTYVSGDTFTVLSPSAATTQFRRSTANGVFNGVYRCTVTDSTAATTYIDVNINTEHLYDP